MLLYINGEKNIEIEVVLCQLAVVNLKNGQQKTSSRW